MDLASSSQTEEDGLPSGMQTGLISLILMVPAMLEGHETLMGKACNLKNPDDDGILSWHSNSESRGCVWKILLPASGETAAKVRARDREARRRDLVPPILLIKLRCALSR